MNPATLAGAVEATCAARPERAAVTQAGLMLSYGELHDAATALARAYRSLGVGRGDRVMCQVGNRPEHVVAMAGAWAAGGVHVGADHQLTGPELSWLVGHTQAAVLLFEPDAAADEPWAALRTVAEEHPRTTLATLGPPPDDVPGASRLEDLLAASGAGGKAASPPSGPEPDDAAIVLFTSGTTGRPKAIVHYHRPLREGWGWIAERLAFSPEDVHLAHLPLSHGFGLSMAVMALMTGGRLVLMREFSTNEALRLVTEQRVTVFNGTPAHFTLMTERLDRSRHDPTSLRIGVGTAAAFPPRLVRRIYDDLGMDLMLMYGSSEGASTMTLERDEILKGSVGPSDPSWVCIVDDEHRPVPAGQIGEIAFRRTEVPSDYWEGGDGSRPPGYRPAPLGDGWYYTGDMGRIDEEGLLYVLGRLKHQVDRGGLKVDPAEVERELLEAPGVVDAAVIGVPDAVLGERVCACVVPATDEVPTLEGLRQVLGRSLAPYKLPERLVLLDAVPRTDLGKVDRSRLRDQVLAAGAVAADG